MIDRLKGKAIWRFGVVFLAFALVFSLAGCAAEEPAAEEPVAEEPVEATELILASTTSTQDSGLFDELIPAFEEAYPEYKVNVIAVGTGEALELGTVARVPGAGFPIERPLFLVLPRKTLTRAAEALANHLRGEL